MRKTLIMAAFAATSLLTTPALAAVHVLNLTGTVANGFSGGFDSGGLHIDFYQLVLDGLTTPFSVEAGDTIQTNLTLDQSFTIPASQFGTFVTLSFFAGAFDPTIAVQASGSFDFSNLGSPFLSSSTTFGSNFPVAGYFSGGTAQPGTGTPGPSITFDQITSILNIDSVLQNGAPIAIPVETATFSYQLNSAATGGIPEPASWALMIAGFGLTGAAMRRRTKIRFATV